MVLDFYDVGELIEAKRQLLSDIKNIDLNVEVPHIPERRDGESKAVHTVHDIFTILTFLDENLKIDHHVMLLIIQMQCRRRGYMMVI